MGLYYFHATAAPGEGRRWFQIPSSGLALEGEIGRALPPRFQGEASEFFYFGEEGERPPPYYTLTALSPLAPPGNGGLFQIRGPALPLGDLLRERPLEALSSLIIAQLPESKVWATGELYGEACGPRLEVKEDAKSRLAEATISLSLHSRFGGITQLYPALPIYAIRFLEGGGVLALGPGELPYPSLAALLEDFPLYPSELALIRLTLPSDPSPSARRLLEVAGPRYLWEAPPSTRALLAGRVQSAMIPASDLEALNRWASAFFPPPSIRWNTWEG